MSEFKRGDKVIFGRRSGEQTRGTVVKVNAKSIKVRQDEARGTMRNYPVGTVWKVAPALVSRDPFPTPVEPPAATDKPNLVQQMIDAATNADPVVGATIIKVRPMTDAELQAEYWPVHEWDRPVVIELSNGTKLFAMQDHEGNGPGVLVGATRTGESFALAPAKAS